MAKELVDSATTVVDGNALEAVFGSEVHTPVAVPDVVIRGAGRVTEAYGEAGDAFGELLQIVDANIRGREFSPWQRAWWVGQWKPRGERASPPTESSVTRVRSWRHWPDARALEDAAPDQFFNAPTLPETKEFVRDTV